MEGEGDGAGGVGTDVPVKRKRGRPPGSKTGTGVAARRAAAKAAASAGSVGRGGEASGSAPVGSSGKGRGSGAASRGKGGKGTDSSAGSGDGSAPLMNLHVARRAEEALVRTEGLFAKVMELHEDLDDRTMRRTEDAKEAVADGGHIVERTFRVWITSTVHNTTPGCWSLRIQGALLSKGDVATDNAVQKPPTSSTGAGLQRTRFSHFFRRVIIELEDDAFPGANLFEWDSATSLVTDAVEVTRPGSKPTVAKIILELENSPKRYLLTDALREITGSERTTETFSVAVEKICQYTEEHGLLDSTGNPHSDGVRLDDKLRNLLDLGEMEGRDPPQTVSAMTLFSAVRAHCMPIEPIEVCHRIGISSHRSEDMTTLNVKVYVEENAKSPISVLISNGFSEHSSSELARYRNKSYEYFEQMMIHRRRQEFLEHYGADAKGMVDAILMSKTKDEKAGRLYGGRGIDSEDRKKDPLKAPWVAETVQRMVIKKGTAAARKELEQPKQQERGEND